MINFAHDHENGADSFDHQSEGRAPDLPVSLTRQFSADAHRLVGPQIMEQPGLHATTNRLSEHLPVPATTYVPRTAVSESIAPSASPQEPGTVSFHPIKEVRNTAKAFVGGGAVAGTLATGAMLATTGISAEGAALAALTAAPIALNAAAVMGGTYLGGALHNLVWQRPGGKKPGFWGTMGRGLISPVSVPVGVAYRLVRINAKMWGLSERAILMAYAQHP